MAKNLVIVESPAKAKTIEKFLGSDFQVESSYGHIADLPSKEIGVDVENGFKPKYEVSADKKALVTKLKGLAKKADMVWLASDEDREGEAISWHLSEELKLDKNKTLNVSTHLLIKKHRELLKLSKDASYRVSKIKEEQKTMLFKNVSRWFLIVLWLLIALLVYKAYVKRVKRVEL